jgi:hypothetical protein
MSEESDRVLAAWFCAECYGKHYIAGMKHGVTSETTVDFTKNTDIVVTLEKEDGTVLYTLPVPLLKRDYSKASHFLHEFFDPHGVAWDGPIDTNYVSYWGDLAGGQSCWGTRKNDDNGSYSVSSEFENSQIYFADLRNNLVSLYHETGGHSGGTSGNGVIGMNLTYGGWGGGEGACMDINILDAIKMPLTLPYNVERKERITLGDYTPHTGTPTNATSSFGVAASDRSGLSGGVAYDTYAWGTYDAIDETKPYNCSEGSYENLALPEALEAYRNSWEEFGYYNAMDNYDESIFNQAFYGQGINGLPNGTYDYPSFVEIDPNPHGSWAISATDKRFYSQKNRDNETYFAKLDGEEPEIKVKEFADGTKNTYTTYYPIAPV